ncbi:MAG TPA: O-methyltransferase [Ignavibacteria bacterium]|nr:O-methyltransferase [Ignavibacteria bacterium]
MTKKILYSAQQKYLDSIQSESEPLLKEMEEFAYEKQIPILSKAAADFLEQTILIHRPKRVLEIGMAIGYSSIRIAKTLRGKGILDTIELSKDNIKIAQEFISRSGNKDKINIIEGDALKLLPIMIDKYDFIFIDADKEDYEKLFYYSLLLLNKRGVMFVDNLLWHGYVASKNVPVKYKTSADSIRKFNKLFISQKVLKTTILPIGDGIGLGIKLD